ncbi:MAG TPA: hypothetical protein VFR03_14100 [Thermoanaerobaculia bacterium]|nr:hypothetical protein [Thermoanaerobaculia bacterium]
MHRPRHRRRDPQRTGPIRNAGGAWKGGGPSYDPLDPNDDDAASSGVYRGYSVINEQMYRGYRTAEEVGGEPRSHGPYGPERRERRPGPGYGEPRHRDRGHWHRHGDHWDWHGGGPRFLSLPLRQLERLIDEILHQIGSARPDPFRLGGLLVQLQIEAVSELVRLGLGGWMDPYRGEVYHQPGFDEPWEPDEEPEEDEPGWEWPAAPSSPVRVRATVPIPVYVWAEEGAEVDLDLRPGSQDLELRAEALQSVDAGHPAIMDADFVPVAPGLTVLRVIVPPGQPSGRYRGVVRIRGAGRPVGTLTVEVGVEEAHIPVTEEGVP